MIRSIPLAALALMLAGTAAAAQQMVSPPEQMKATPGAYQLTVALGPLGTGKILERERVGTIGLFHSDLAQVVSTSPEAERAARVFARNQMIGRPTLLLGAIAVVGGLAAYASRSGAVGIGGREAAAIAVGAGGLMYGADRLVVSRRALSQAIGAYNRDRGQ